MKQGIWEVSTVREYPIGLTYRTGNRRFRYMEAGALITNPYSAPIGLTTWKAADNVDGTAPVGALGSKSIVVVAAGIGENDLRGGIIRIEDVDPDFRYMMEVVSNTATDGDGKITIALDAGLPVALTTSDEIKLYPNVWKDVVKPDPDITANAQYRSCVGVLLLKGPIAKGSFFWGQVEGPCYLTNYSTDPGQNEWDRSVYFYSFDGALMTGTDVASLIGSGKSDLVQRIGFAIPTTENGDGSCYFMLQLP